MSSLPPRSHSWFVPAIFAVILFVGGVASNLIANYVQLSLEPYRPWVWLAFAIAMIVTVVAAIRDYRKSDEPPAQHNTVTASGSGAVAIGNNVTSATIITGSVGGDVVLRERHTQGVGQRTAQGWIDKVIKPMLWSLEQVESLLAQNRVLTWQHQTGDFARIPTARNLVQVEAKYSLEDFVEHYPEVQEGMSLYDQRRANLKAACQCLQKAIMGKKQFYDLYEKAKADDSEIAGRPISSDFEGFKETEHLERVINFK